MLVGNAKFVDTVDVSGGLLSSDSTYYYRRFISSGSLVISNGAIPIETLVIGGGGGGQSFNSGVAWGKGGAGGFTAVSSAQTFAAGTYTVTIGSGGAGGTGNGGAVGTAGVASSIVGGSISITSNGGQGGNTTSSPNYSEYGAGNTYSNTSGFGGIGITSGWGIPTTKFAGGGSNGNPNFGARPGDDGSFYGGGLSRSTAIQNLPTANTGGAGQGGGNTADGMPSYSGQTGGSGIVIVRYLKSAVLPTQTDFELIGTITLSAAQSSVTFTGLPTDYKHLQLRVVTKSTAAGSEDNFKMQFNGDTGNNYITHNLYGTGAATNSNWPGGAQNYTQPGSVLGASAGASVFGVHVIDILDAFSSTKNKTVRTSAGFTDAAISRLYLTSGLWMSTAVLSSIAFSTNGNIAANSRFSLYGVRG